MRQGVRAIFVHGLRGFPHAATILTPSTLSISADFACLAVTSFISGQVCSARSQSPASSSPSPTPQVCDSDVPMGRDGQGVREVRAVHERCGQFGLALGMRGVVRSRPKSGNSGTIPVDIREAAQLTSTSAPGPEFRVHRTQAVGKGRRACPLAHRPCGQGRRFSAAESPQKGKIMASSLKN